MLSLPYDVHSPGRARRFVERFAVEQALDGKGSALCVIVTELVANALLHGAAPVVLTVHFDHDEVAIEVADGDSRINDVRFPTLDDPDPGGYGLRIVASLADRWGIWSSPSGKTVWATVSRPSASL
jgi:anti-sigma regulatory factor (Ser/Thr protein kinase)